MADFVQTMKDWRRMCESCDRNEKIGCVVNGSVCAGFRKMIDEIDLEGVEANVTAWAAEHPEPVYPSIAKYLEQFGITIRRDGSLEADFFKANEPMSADMAKMLGISSEEVKMKKPIDITGKRFGMLTVLGYDHSFNRNTYWLCKCDCGNTKVVKRSSLMGGDIVSCGCYRNKLFMKNRQESEHEDLSQFKFSMLTPICRDYEAEQRYSYPKTMWKCQCDCGNVITVAAEKLKTGSTKSCGCYKRTSGEARIAELLDNNGIDYLYDKPCFDDLVLPGGSIGRYDFVLFDVQHKPYRIIEFDGEEHKASNKPSALYSEARLNQIRQYDAFKNEYAMKHGIPLVRIPYSEKGAITLDLLFSDKYLVSA